MGTSLIYHLQNEFGKCLLLVVGFFCWLLLLARYEGKGV